MKRSIMIHENDNVSTVLEDVHPGEQIVCNGTSDQLIIASKSEIPRGHKVATRTIEKGGDIVKYGEPVGFAKEEIPDGMWVHVHNVGSYQTEERT